MRPELFTTGLDRIQLVAGPGLNERVEVAVGDGSWHKVFGEEPAVWTLKGLQPNTAFEAKGSNGWRINGRTLPSPGGKPLTRVATLSDLHVGKESWGFLGTMLPAGPRKDGLDFGHAATSAVDALGDISDWNPDHTVIKGDAVDHRIPEQFALLGKVLDGFPDLGFSLLTGNHDVDNRGDMPLPEVIGKRGLAYQREPVSVMDFPGLRLITMVTHIERRGTGTLSHSGPLALDAAADARRQGRGCLICMHHQLQTTEIARSWPPGIPLSEARPWLDGLDSANPNSMVTSGHVHRNRARRHGQVVVTEVASTRDWPGVWAAYEVFEGGIVQTVLKISAPRSVAWHHYSRDAAGGLWGRWASGSLNQRCLVMPWPAQSTWAKRRNPSVS